jgi:phosphatidylglycerol:prolipoprotein diacylglycerol transferase
MFGCDFGKPLSGSAPEWLKKLGTFPHWPDGTLDHGSGSPAWVQHVQHRGLSFDAPASFPVHPTQIYESLVGLFLLGVLLFVRKHQKFRGQVFMVFTFGYGVLRFLLEIIRDDIERGEYGPTLAEHLILPGSLALFALAYSFGMAQSVKDPIMRRMTQAISFIPAIVAYLVLKPESFADQNLVKLSTSQWVGLLTGVAAAIAYGIYWKAAEAHPTSAMSLGLEGFDPNAEPEPEPEPEPAKAAAAKDDDADEKADADAKDAPSDDSDEEKQPA